MENCNHQINTKEVMGCQEIFMVNFIFMVNNLNQISNLFSTIGRCMSVRCLVNSFFPSLPQTKTANAATNFVSSHPSCYYGLLHKLNYN